MFVRCVSNTKIIHGAIKLYRENHNGQYPESLRELAPDYLRRIPPCGAVHRDTYSESYELIIDEKTGEVTGYSFCCRGHNHGNFNVAPDYPRCNSETGINTGK